MKEAGMILKQFVCSVLALSLVFSGCSSVRKPEQHVTVTTDYRDAEIYVNGIMEGHGRVTVPVKRDSTALVVVRRGDMRVQHAVESELNWTGYLDIFGGVLWLVPLLGLLAPGSKSLKETNIQVALS